eukprot:TRINITY_DN1774_c0_g1_i1.p3 TRINITY_DN1774_c0_g1~~TRINITY_DN1774_c0_g1_i1.p3  ORF type:complete len:132 (-),score=11.04 TRINITY_DN1774_c0_g1_i1:222-617(-)
MNDLSFDRNVFVSNLFLGNLNIFYSLFRYILRNVLSQIFNSVVIGNCDLTRNSLDFSLFLVFNSFDLLGNTFNLSLVFVFNDLLFEGNILDSAFSLDDLFSSVDGGSDNVSTCNSFFSVGSSSNSFFSVST